MNIFYLHRDPYKAAEYQYNKHVVKMILESAQMLCTAHHHYAEQSEADVGYIPYKKAHYNHPSTKWVRESDEHYMWLFDHMVALGEEYTKRYGKTHLTINKCFLPLYTPKVCPINCGNIVDLLDHVFITCFLSSLFNFSTFFIK